jgi:peptidoglycan hydrolase-like protein with peptidoglycan-binding domain
MQQLLVEQGYLNAGGADGIFGGGSEKALMKYQQDRGLNPDGIAWPQTLKDLEHDFGPWKVVKPMTRTESGERVRVCQGCGFEQHEAIDGGAVLEKGDRGENVRAMQQIIKQVGYDAGSFDGIYGGKLDNALAGFAADNDMIVEKGKIRPADVDAVVNAWIEKLPAESWKGEGSLETPVDLALTVEPVGETDENGIASYSWSVTNLGSQKATFTALLLTFGEPNFQQENLVMVLDGLELKANAGNSASGSFNVDANWGEGNLNFAALAVTDPEGAVWLSNTASFDNGASPAEKTVLPMDNQIDANRLADGIYPVSFNSGDVLVGASGVFMNAVHIYTEDCYDIADIAALKVGDTIVIEGEPVPVLSIDENEYGYSVNEGEEARTFDLVAREASNCYVVSEDDDMSTYTERGVTTLVLAPTATFTDGWDIESDPVTTGYDGIVAALQESGNNYFVPHNTTLRVENGQVMEINRVYVP